MLSQLGKVFARIIYNRLFSWVEESNLLHDDQAGFRKNHETLDNLLIIRVRSDFTSSDFLALRFLLAIFLGLS